MDVGFVRAETYGVHNIILRDLPIANGVTLKDGDAVRLVNGRLALAATNNPVLGICIERTAKTGNAGGTVSAQIEITKEAVYWVDQGAIADAASEMGDKLDINGTADGVAAVVNGDLTVVEQDTAKDRLKVTFNNRQIAA